MKQLTRAEQKEAEISMLIHDHLMTKKLLKEFIDKAQAEGHGNFLEPYLINPKYFYSNHMNCAECDLLKEAKEAHNG